MLISSHRIKFIPFVFMFCLGVFALTGSLAIAAESASYVQDSFSMDSEMINSDSSSFLLESMMNDFILPSTPPSTNSIVRHAVEVELYYYSNANAVPSILSAIASPSYVALGDSTTLDIVLNENLSSWAVTINGVNVTSSGNVQYTYNHLYVRYRPETSGDGPFYISAQLTDMGLNAQTIQYPVSLVVDSGLPKLQYALIPDEMATQVNIGRKGAEAIVFTLAATETANVLNQIIISVDSSAGLTAFETIGFYKIVSDNLSVQQLSLLPMTADSSGITYSLLANQNSPSMNTLVLTMLSTNIVDVMPSKYLLTFDLSDTVAANQNLGFSILELSSKKITGDSHVYVSTTNLMSKAMMTVSKTKPVVVQTAVRPFVGVADLIKPDIIHEIAQNNVTSFRYRFMDVSANTYLPWRQEVYIAAAAPGNRYRLLNNQLRGFTLVHNRRYIFQSELQSSETSDITSSNSFLVDLTLPLVPAKMTLRQLQSVSNVVAADSTKVTAELTLQVSQSLDPESGLSGYRVFRKTDQAPEWKLIQEGTVVTSAAQIKVQVSESTNGRYFYNFSVQNQAENWSIPSDISVLDLRTNTTMGVITFFNSPNPFDSRKENTTLYYTLGDNSAVQLKIYDIFGYLVKSWDFNSGAAGGSLSNSIVWDGTNLMGAKVSKGVYLVILKATASNGQTDIKKYKIGVLH